MPKNNRNKSLLFALVLILFGGYLLFSGLQRTLSDKVVTPRGVLYVEVMNTPEERQKGLSGRNGLGRNDGMLFAFDEPAKTHCLWMKDMLFSIDMVWLDDKKRVVDMKTDVAPDTYPAETFCPDSDARYALEVSAGRAEQLGIKEGETLSFSISD